MARRGKVALTLTDVTKIYPNGTVANHKINLEVKYGQIHALFGENGSGKTTLVKNILGENKITSGQIRVDDKLLSDNSPEKARMFDIAAVHQHFSLIGNFSVFENVVLSGGKKSKNQELSKTVFCYQNALKKKVKGLIKKFNLNLKLEDIVADLAVNKKQKTEILKVLFREAKIIIFDEPTSVISTAEIDKLLKLLLAYKKMGKAIIFISHKIKEVRKIADWVTILRKGKVVGSFAIQDITDKKLIALMVGKQQLSDLSKLKRKAVSDVLLNVDNLSLRKDGKDVLKEVSFTLKKGEIVGLAGLEENGQKELLEAIFQLQKNCSGTITYQNNIDLLQLSSMEVRDNKIGYVPQDRQNQSLVLEESIAFNTFFTNWNSSHFFRFGLIQWDNIFAASKQIIDKYHVYGVHTLQQKIKTLSGGNQQKFIIGRELESQPQLLLLHEPMWGIDVGTINYLTKLLVTCRNRGQSILFTSSEINDVLTLSDRVLVISRGHIMGEVSSQDKNASWKIGQLMTKKVV